MARAIEILRMVAPDARRAYLAAFRDGDALLKAHDITTPQRLAHFLAQVLHESGGLTVEWESGNYSAARLLEIFGVGRHSAAVTPAEAERLARNAEAIFERVYGVGNPVKSRELGNTRPGDGFRYRGGGLLQTTGRDNYRRMGRLCGVDFEANPELIVSAEHALKPALAEWTEGNLNRLADQDEIVLITKKINGGTIGLADRRRWLARLKPLIKSVDFAEGAVAEAPTAGPTPGPDAAAKRGTGGGLLRRALPHLGEDYVNRQVPKDDANWTGPWDCAEFVSWLVYQEAGILYGCVDNRAPPAAADAYTGAWRRDAERHGIRVSVEQAASTVGGIVLRYPPPGGMGHIALCDGKGGTVEAKGKRYGVVADKVDGRTWHIGILIPGIDYGADGGVVSVPVRPPADIYARRAVNMDPAVVVEIQKALRRKGFDPGEIDGEFGPMTEAAVVDFQIAEGLVVDGEVGRDTAAALGIALSRGASVPPGPTSGPGPGSGPGPAPFDVGVPSLGPIDLGAQAMNPFLVIAARVLPDIAKALVGDKAGAVTSAITKAVTETTQTRTAEEAREKLAVDPAAYTALQIKLAEIAAAQDEARQKAQFAMLQARLEADTEKRRSELQALQLERESTSEARATLRAIAGQGGVIAWTAPILSYVVTLGFFAVLVLLVVKGLPKLQASNETLQVVNIVIGALTAAFATVINFWLGSSQGSRLKDVAAISREETQSVRLEQATRAAERPNGVMPGPKPKPKDQLDRCLDIVLSKEVASDTGAATRYGLTLADLVDTWRKTDLTPADLQKLTREQACEVYRVRYWNVLKCDELPVGVDLVVFDTAAETDVVQAAKLLQKVVGANEDGSVGPVTLGAVGLMTPRAIVTRLSELRRERLRMLQTGGAGAAAAVGTSRIEDVDTLAREMIDRAAET
ncbi:peptidoglycan-binding protein [Rhodoplanes azumiensis]|uniref:Peptidoglycan-binding protein n=1 Tax=Rhodoplanes azumiensis TaxID=1897628 RepID=A0ABW5AGV6_9BRAD